MNKKKSLNKEERVNRLFDNINSLSKTIKSTKNIVMGIDPGRTSPGLAFATINDDKNIEKFTINTKLNGFGKVIEVESWMMNHVSTYPPAIVLMEDYAFDSEWGREKAGEMVGVIKRRLWLQEIPLISVAPQSLKAFIGAMKKEEIMKEVLKRYGIDTSKSDEADAVVLAKMGIGINKIIQCGMTLANQDDKKVFENAAYKFINLTHNEAKTLINILIMRGEEANEFARGKEKARKTKGK